MLKRVAIASMGGSSARGTGVLKSPLGAAVRQSRTSRSRGSAGGTRWGVDLMGAPPGRGTTPPPAHRLLPAATAWSRTPAGREYLRVTDTSRAHLLTFGHGISCQERPSRKGGER